MIWEYAKRLARHHKLLTGALFALLNWLLFRFFRQGKPDAGGMKSIWMLAGVILLLFSKNNTKNKGSSKLMKLGLSGLFILFFTMDVDSGLKRVID